VPVVTPVARCEPVIPRYGGTRLVISR
jgi:hypothetical protein